jgi:PTS system galactitol-specific IIA component
MSEMVDVALCMPGLTEGTSEGVVRALARRLAENGYVLPTYEAAAVAREKRSPTGLPFPGVAVALPHADPDQVQKPGIALASLASPVTFRQMGSPGTKLEVRLVVMPALTAKEQAAAGLSRLIERLQDAALRDALLEARSPEAMRAVLGERWTP